MPKVNYKYNKRQKDIAKKKKREEKAKRRQEKKKNLSLETNSEAPAEKPQETPEG
ncbi:MAG: hypothetical protein QGM50_11960 [Anaerolineae bacterium]|nr:hypothetical protein [Anaerolineae bacterium]MDK1080099.1 hypothetical protein [Anaerolineae bacterium]MDK1119486.1 hypothetical protein [Anaerolineae bacterium]